jgi:CRISPR-associated endonuclease/helicase Cas3
MPFYAHTKGNDKAEWQSVLQHLTATAELARELGEDTGLADFAYAAALLHDLGKYAPEFQRRLEGSSEKVDHATAGAKEIEQLMISRGQPMIGRLLAYCIAGHHGGLPDGGSPVDTEDDVTLSGRMKRALKDYSAYTTEIDLSFLSVPTRFPEGFQPIQGASSFSVAFAVRMIFSILVDADFLETETFCNGGKKPRGEYTSITNLSQQFSAYLQRFANPVREIDFRRSSTLNECMARGDLPTGLYSLTLPTGAGKTIASMAFALRHAVKHGLKRIIYVIPYTSIIEQNAAVFKGSLSGFEDHILEHHSNFEWEPVREEPHEQNQNSALAKLKWAAENWDIPIIVTTNVQFFESLFANRNSRSRKIHNLARSVIIFDEAQMLPREYIKPCIYSVVELVQNYGATAVLCTATQPALGRFLPRGILVQELISNPQKEFDYYRRVQVKQLGRQTDADLLERLNSHKQVLCIVNTRKHARALFEGLQGKGCFHLSTLMCAVHRREIVAEIRQRLAQDLPCRVVSTQLIEAGVDLDFPVGYRALSGLDSIIQSAGRVNRENKRAEGFLYVFDPDSDYARYVPKYIEQTAQAAKIVLRSHSSDPISLEAVQAYYNLLFGMSDPDIFDSKKILSCFEKGGNPPTFHYATAADNFKLIENDTVPVIVAYEPDVVNPLLEELEKTLLPRTVLRKLQPFTVNIYQPEYQALVREGAVRLYAGRYAVLNQPIGRYSPQTGLELRSRRGAPGIFVDA